MPDDAISHHPVRYHEGAGKGLMNTPQKGKVIIGMSLGKNIGHYRNAMGWTQAQLAEKMNVSFQTVSYWELDTFVPELQKLQRLAELFNVRIDRLLADTEDEWEYRDRFFDPDRMFTFLKSTAAAKKYKQTLAVLNNLRQWHAGQTRQNNMGPETVPYVIHPLTLACQALAMQIDTDDVLAALLLHDVVEDCGVQLDELPVGDTVKKAVRLVSYNTYPGPKKEIKATYYANILTDPLACLVKCMDRCNNLSTMAMGFTTDKMRTYVRESEIYLMPVLKRLKEFPEYNSAAWQMQYQIVSYLEIYKRLL